VKISETYLKLNNRHMQRRNRKRRSNQINGWRSASANQKNNGNKATNKMANMSYQAMT